VADLVADIEGGLGDFLTAAIIDPLSSVLDQLAEAGKGGAAGAGLGNITGLLGAFADNLARVPSAMEPFIAALAPGLIQQFSYSLRTLQATIGTALAPAFQILNRVIRDAAGLIAPAMKALQPIMTELAQVVSQTVLPVVDELGAIIESFSPIVVQLVGALTPVLTAFRVILTSVIRAVTDWVKALLGTGGTGWVDSFRRAVEQVAKYLILLSARIALLLGATGYVDALKKSLENLGGAGVKPQGVAPAPEGVRTSGLEDIARQMAEAAVVAGGGPAPEDPQLKAMTDILNELKALKADTNWKELLNSVWEDISKTGLPDAISKGVQAAWLWIQQQAGQALSLIHI